MQPRGPMDNLDAVLAVGLVYGCPVCIWNSEVLYGIVGLVCHHIRPGGQRTGRLHQLDGRPQVVMATGQSSGHLLQSK